MKKLFNFIVALLVMGFFVFFSMFFLIYHTAAQDTESNVDALVVLGAAQYDGTPSPVFQSRLDHALQLYNAGRAPLIIVSGGKQVGDTYSEAVSGKKYLMNNKVPESVIVTDENSFSTKQNLTRVKDIVDDRSINSLIIVSDPFHMFRALHIARGLQLTVFGSPTRTSPISENRLVEFKYVAREVLLSYAHIVFGL